MKEKSGFNESLLLNNSSFSYYFNYLKSLYCTSIKTYNLPDTIDEKYINLAFFDEGKCLFFKDDVLGYLGLRSADGGELSVYNIPSERHVVTANGYTNNLDADNSVIVYANYLRRPPILDITNFALRLANIERTIDVNVNAQKTPIMILCREEERLTMKNWYMKYEGNEPFIFADKSFNTDEIKVLNTEAPYVAENLFNLKEKIMREAMEYIGITAQFTDKKERLITGELQSSQGAAFGSRFIRLQSLNEGYERFNKMFGTNIYAEFNGVFAEETSLIENNAITEEGDNNGTLHNGSENDM